MSFPPFLERKLTDELDRRLCRSSHFPPEPDFPSGVKKRTAPRLYIPLSPAPYGLVMRGQAVGKR